MTIFKPTICINRLVVTRNNAFVLDLKFHEGLNVIRGENSVGKTTIMRFLIHGLGGESLNFNQYASLCDDTILEVSLNETIITLKREIEGNSLKPLMIFWGVLDDAVTAVTSSWELYPFKRSENKDSFSQVLFRLLGMPELRSDSGANITMHQLTRLIYSDQETTTSELFRHERFDPAITRAAIGDYLLGIDSNELYTLKLEQGELQKELSGIKSAIRTIYSTFGIAGTDINLDFLNERVNSITQEISTLGNKLSILNKNVIGGSNSLVIFNESANSMIEPSDYIEKNDETININSILELNSAIKEDDRIRIKLDSIHSTLSKLKQRNLDLEGEIADTELFIQELNDRFKSLEESSVAETFLGSALFKHCPSCFSEVKLEDTSLITCPLCKSTISKSSAKSQLARMQNELALQLKESIKIRESQREEIKINSTKISNLKQEYKNLENTYLRNRNSWRSERDIAAQEIAKSLGAKEQELTNTLELRKLASILENHTHKASEIEARLSWVSGRIESVTNEQIKRRLHAYSLVADSLKKLLHEDLERQDEFRMANMVDIDFAANRVSIDGQYQFSASSMVYLKHSFHVALLLASTMDESFRFPRLTLLDGIDDGGMESIRSFDFQNRIKKLSTSTKIKHQIIITTVDISPELDTPEFIVGDYYTHTKKSLLIK